MIDFQKLKRISDDNSAASRTYIDDFMMHYAADRGGVAKEMEMQFKRMRHVIHELPGDVVNRMKAQYIIHNVFRKDGLIRKLINHVEVKTKGADALAFFKHQQDHPWRFTFTEMIDMPAPDFHLHVDVFSGEEYLIYSPGMSETFKDHHESVQLWFNLLAFNGHCWQTYGPIGSYKAINADDVFFFGTEIDDTVYSDDGMIALIQKRPLPFMSLIIGGNVPVIVNNGIQLTAHTASVDAPSLNTDDFRQDFSIELQSGIIKLSIAPWSDPMHYAAAYFDPTDGELFVYAMTEPGFSGLIKELAKKGVQIDAPDLTVNISSLLTMERILGRKIRINPYDSLFEKATSPEQDDQLKKLNVAIDMAVLDFNAGRKPDYKAYADASGIPVEELRPVIDNSIARIRQLLDRK